MHWFVFPIVDGENFTISLVPSSDFLIFIISLIFVLSYPIYVNFNTGKRYVHSDSTLDRYTIVNGSLSTACRYAGTGTQTDRHACTPSYTKTVYVHAVNIII